MRDRVIDRLPAWFIDRMREWAREKLFPAGSTVPSSFPYDGLLGPSHGSPGSHVPQLLHRAHDTEAALDELAEDRPREEQAVRQYWIYEGRSLTEHGRTLAEHGRRRGVSDNTFATWAINGHSLLIVIFERQRDTWRHRHGRAVTRA